MIWVIIVLALYSNFLWFICFRAYRNEIKRRLPIAKLEARLDEAQRVGHMEFNKNTPQIYHFNDDGSTVILLEDHIDNLKGEISKGETKQ